MEFLVKLFTDAGWWAVILAIVTLIVTVYYARKALQRKEISYSVTSTELVSTLEDFRQRIQILVDSKPAKNVHLIEISARNTGSQPINPNDYFVPVSVNFKSKVDVISKEVTRQSPSDLGVAFIANSPKLEMQNILINPKDSFSCVLLVDIDQDKKINDKDVSLNARISGGKIIRRNDGEVETASRFLSILLSLFILSIGLLIGVFLGENFLPDDFCRLDQNQRSFFLVVLVFSSCCWGVITKLLLDEMKRFRKN